jgi:hypothetical protein
MQFQWPSSKAWPNRVNFGVWSLEFLWDLELGFWLLAIMHCDSIFLLNHDFPDGLGTLSLNRESPIANRR